MVKFQVYLEVEKRKAGCIAATNRQYNPPVCQEVSLQSISSILPQNRLISSFCLTLDQVRNGVRHCLLPQGIPNLILCWRRPAPTPNLVFSLNQYCHLKKLSVSVRHLSA